MFQFNNLFVSISFQAASEANPSLFTIATLTGHVERAYSDKYTVS